MNQPAQDDLPLAQFDENCACEFTPYDDGGTEESWHYKRRCYLCGAIFRPLHCRCEQPRRSCGCNRKT